MEDIYIIKVKIFLQQESKKNKLLEELIYAKICALNP